MATTQYTPTRPAHRQASLLDSFVTEHAMMGRSMPPTCTECGEILGTAETNAALQGAIDAGQPGKEFVRDGHGARCAACTIPE